MIALFFAIVFGIGIYALINFFSFSLFVIEIICAVMAGLAMLAIVSKD